MTQDSGDGVQRREFLTASLVVAGASAALAAGAASAQTETAAETRAGGTVFTGDAVDGKRVVSRLDTGDLEPGQLHRLYFRGVEAPSGQPWLVSVAVARGAAPGRRVTLVSGVHGDEMSSIHTVQTVMAGLDPAAMKGTVMAVFDVARPAIEAMTRRWPGSGRGAELTDLNRVWPGDEAAPSAPARHAGLLFNRLIRPNSDRVIDFHTSTTGIDVPDFNIARMDLPEVREMAELYPVGLIYDDLGYPGILFDALIEAGIPALTPEVGNARRLDPEAVARFVEGTMNVLKLDGIVEGAMGRTARDADVFVGNRAAAVVASAGGMVEQLVGLGEPVTAGQKIAVQRNMFGEMVAEYASPVEGRIGGLRSDATSEPGNVLAFVLFKAPTGDDGKAFPE